MLSILVYEKKQNPRVSSLKSNCGPGDTRRKRKEKEKKNVLCVLCFLLFNVTTMNKKKKRCSHAKSKKKKQKLKKKHANAESSVAFRPSYIITKHEATESEKSS